MCGTTSIAHNSKLYQYCLLVASSRQSLRTVAQMPIHDSIYKSQFGLELMLCTVHAATMVRFQFTRTKASTFANQISNFSFLVSASEDLCQLRPLQYQIFQKNSRGSCMRLLSDGKPFRLIPLSQSNLELFQSQVTVLCKRMNAEFVIYILLYIASSRSAVFGIKHSPTSCVRVRRPSHCRRLKSWFSNQVNSSLL